MRDKSDGGSHGEIAESRVSHRFRVALLALGCTLFVYLLVRLGVAEISALVWRIGWYFGPACAIYAGHHLVRALAYWKCITDRGRCSYGDIVRVRLSGEALQFLTSTGPFLAEPAKVWLLRRRGLSMKDAVAATVSEYLIYLFAAAAFAVAGLLYLLGHFELSGAESVAVKTIAYAMTLFLLAAAFAIVGRIYLIGAILKRAGSLPLIGRHVRTDERAVRDMEDILFTILRDRPLRFLSLLAIEYVAQALLVLELFVLLKAMGQPITLLDAPLIEASTKFIGLAFFFIPGQVGAAESVYAIVFKIVGLPAVAGFAIAVARRLLSLLVAGAGLAFAPVWEPVQPSHESR